MRINKYIAQAGVCSRRKADKLIKDKKVFVNGKIIENFSFDVNKEDTVEIEGKIINIEEKFYYKLNKPIGYISSNSDPYNKKDLESLVKIDKRFFCAGRLDMDSHGLMLITNDGDLVNRIIHPKFEIKKEYIVRVNKLLDNSQLEKFSNDINLGNNEISKDAYIEIFDKKEKIYLVKIHQGYNRQIRRMFDYFGSKVLDLKRTKIGEIDLGNLEEAQYVPLSKKEKEFLDSL